jgi:AcrR family transcriptional regulator
MVSTPGKRHVPTPDTYETVRKLCVLGATQPDIAAALEISTPTLRKHYRTTLRLGTMMACADVADALYRRALNAADPEDAAAPHAAKFFLARRAGWKEGDKAYDMDWCALEESAETQAAERADALLQESLVRFRQAGLDELASSVQAALLQRRLQPSGGTDEREDEGPGD